jgi:hypothetical protein
MPCDTIVTVKLELKNANLTLLQKVVEEITGRKAYVSGNIVSWGTGSYNKLTSQLTVRSQSDGQQIKRAYSGELVKAQAKRFGWQIKEISQYQYQILKR